MAVNKRKLSMSDSASSTPTTGPTTSNRQRRVVRLKIPSRAYAEAFRNAKRAALSRLLESRKPLRRDIQRLVTAHQHDLPVPHFSPAELVVMAIIDSDSEYSTQSDILKWIHKTFPLSKIRLLDAMTNDIYKDRKHMWDVEVCLKHIHEGFMGVFFAYDTPLSVDSIKRRFNVDKDQARLFLRHRLEPQRKGAFRSLDLPAELRNRIYEMVLIFPCRVLRIGSGRDSEDTRPKASQRDSTSSLAAYDGSSEFPIHDLPKVLSLTAVCKHISEETLPIFYGGNKFSFPHLRPLEYFFKKSSQERLILLKSIHLEVFLRPLVDRDEDRGLQRMLDALRPFVKLELLDVQVCPCSGATGVNPRRRTGGMTWDTVADVPSFRALARLGSRAEKVKVSLAWHCPSDASVEEVERYGTSEADKMR